MTQHTPSLERPVCDSEYLAPEQWRGATLIVDSLKTDEAFIQRLEAQWLDPSITTTLKYAETFAVYVEDYCNYYQSAEGLTEHQTTQIRLLANASLHIRNQDVLAHYDEQRKIRHFPIEESNYYQGFKPYAIWYNQLLARYAYLNPDDTMANLNLIQTQQAPLEFIDRQELVAERIATATRGARTEAVTRYLFDLAGVKYVPGTLEEDLEGGDFIVMYNGHRVKVDIKSSLHKIAILRGGYAMIKKECIDFAIQGFKRKNRKNKEFSIVLYAGFKDADLGDSLSLQLTPDEIWQHAQSLKSQLYKALEELWPSKSPSD